MRLDVRFSRSVLYDFFFWYFVSCLVVRHEFTDVFTEVAYLNPYVLKELISVTSPDDHDSFPCQEELHGKSWSEGVGVRLFVKKNEALSPKVDCSWPQKCEFHLIYYLFLGFLHPYCVYWGDILFPWVWIQSCDDAVPDLHWVEVFTCPPLGHFLFISVNKTPTYKPTYVRKNVPEDTWKNNYIAPNGQ